MNSAKSAKQNATTSTLRIIGGRWRGRKFSFQDAKGLRPSGDRIRERVFNWLMHDVNNASCLDLFAGSGALGLEALSRNATKLVFIDNNKATVTQIKKNLAQFDATNADVIATDALKWLEQNKGGCFDIIFLDPPFYQNLLPKAVELIYQGNLLGETGYLYMELEKDPISLAQLPNYINIEKDKTAGQVRSLLATFQ